MTTSVAVHRARVEKPLPFRAGGSWPRGKGSPPPALAESDLDYDSWEFDYAQARTAWRPVWDQQPQCSVSGVQGTYNAFFADWAEWMRGGVGGGERAGRGGGVGGGGGDAAVAVLRGRERARLAGTAVDGGAGGEVERERAGWRAERRA